MPVQFANCRFSLSSGHDRATAQVYIRLCADELSWQAKWHVDVIINQVDYSAMFLYDRGFGNQKPFFDFTVGPPPSKFRVAFSISFEFNRSVGGLSC